MKILIIGGVSASLVNFRGPLIRAMQGEGHEVSACAGEATGKVIETLGAWNVQFLPVELARAGMRPWQDIRTFRQILAVIREVQPDVVLSYTVKPVIYGGLAARWARVPGIYSLITGLGYAFTQGNGLRGKIAGGFASWLYRAALAHSRRVFFQNPDDMREFAARGLVREGQCMLVDGSGVDLSRYASAELPAQPRFLMIARLLADKGVREYVAAARQLAAHPASAAPQASPSPSFALAGSLDPNPSSVSRAELDAWRAEEVIDYLGELVDVRPAYRDCTVYVLPSYYREGTPRTVLEAMSMGRPIITTNSPGCRETVLPTVQEEGPKVTPAEIFPQANGRMPRQRESPVEWARSRGLTLGANGILVPARNTDALVAAMRFFIEYPEQIPLMGRASRHYAEKRYDVHQVNAAMLRAMGLLFHPFRANEGAIGFSSAARAADCDNFVAYE